MRRAIVNTLAGICLVFSKALECLGLRKVRDPWRHTAGLNLRSEAGKFTLSAFAVSCPGNTREEIARRLRDFLGGEPIVRVAVGPGRNFTRIMPLDSVDVVTAGFAADGALESISPTFDPSIEPQLDASLREQIHRTLIEGANATRHLCIAHRAADIQAHIARRHRDRKAHDYAMRVLQSAFLSFEDNIRSRFLAPDPSVFRHPGTGLLHFTVRPQQDNTADFWMQVHHTPVDGLPMQEMLTRLERHFGVGQSPRFPSADSHTLCSLPAVQAGGERKLVSLVGFYSFSAIKELRKKINTCLAASLSEPAGIGAVLVWCLAHQPEFAGLKIAVVVDVPASERHARAVDFAVIEPRAFFNAHAPFGGFAAFAAAYSGQVGRARLRQTRTFKTMVRSALIPPAIAQAVLRCNPRAHRYTFGTLGLSIIKSASVFLSPIGDVGHEHGFITIGNIDLPSDDGGTVGSVCIIGDPEVVGAYPAALRRALSDFPFAQATPHD